MLVLLGVIVCAQSMQAQNLWEEGRNIAGEAVGTPLGQEAGAFIGGQFTSGEFRSPSMGKTLWSAQTKAQAVSAYQDLYLKGNFGFDLTYGTQMMGSMFTNPGYYPVDVLEFTPGTKVKQTYDIGGGFAWKNGSRWTPGVDVTFQGINYAKRKDLRHTTYRQDLEVVPSIFYGGEILKLGLSAILGKNSEFIRAEQINTAAADTYMAFLDKGIRYGSLQAWEGSGVHLKGDGVDRFPVKQYSFGAAVQGGIKDFIYWDIEYVRTLGEVGEKGYTWFRFPGNSLEAKFIYTLRGNDFTHILRADAAYHYEENYESVIDKVTVGGVTTPVIYGNNRIFRHEDYCVEASYRLRHASGWMAGTSIELEGNWDLSTLMFPYYDDDRSRHFHWRIMGMVPVGRFILQAGGLFICKVGEHSHVVDDADVATGVSSAPTRLQDWWDREQEAADATRFALSASARYNFDAGLYLEAGCNWMHAFGIKLLSGSDRQTTYLRLGYNF